MAVGEVLWLLENDIVGVGGGVIVLVTDGLRDVEVDIDVDTLLESEGDEEHEVECVAENDAEGETL